MVDEVDEAVPLAPGCTLRNFRGKVFDRVDALLDAGEETVVMDALHDPVAAVDFWFNPLLGFGENFNSRP